MQKPKEVPPIPSASNNTDDIIMPRIISEEQPSYSKQRLEKEMERVTIEINAKYEKYVKNSSTHPAYNDEWQKFWQLRYNEIAASGKDPDTYNYKPDWALCWNDLLNQFKLDEMRNERIRIAKKLEKLHDERKKTPDKPKTSEQCEKRSSYNGQLKPHSSRDQRPKSPVRSSNANSKRDMRPKSPVRPSNSYARHDKRQRSPDRRPSTSCEISKRIKKEPKECVVVSSADESDSETLRDEISFVSVCRLLSAVERDVGSLGPKCLELQVKAIEVQKSHPTKYNQIMMTLENATLLNLVKEKLLGLLELELLPNKRINGVKKIITNIKKLLKKFPLPMNDDGIKKNWTEIIRSIDGDNQLGILVEVLSGEISGGKTEESQVAEVPKNQEIQQPTEPINQTENNVPAEITDNECALNPADLSDEDLKLLLGNFDQMSVKEQGYLVAFLSNLEKTDPARVLLLKPSLNEA